MAGEARRRARSSRHGAVLSRGTFLSAQWRHVAILNYQVEPAALSRLVPGGTELDKWDGRWYLSVVGFLFLGTRVLGVPIPFHRDFEEVNLRFYVRRWAGDGWRRGVVFVKELVPRIAVAAVARVLYNENYFAVPMSHQLKHADDHSGIESVSYAWHHAGRPGSLRVSAREAPSQLVPGSLEEFVAEHYWGYSIQRDGRTCEYEVKHPPWRVASAGEAALECDVGAVYGEELGRFLRGAPASAFLADGSAITVSRGTRLAI